MQTAASVPVSMPVFYDNNEGKEPNANVTTNSGTVEITGVNYGAKIGGTFTVAGGEVTVAATGSSGKAIETDSVKISPTAPQLTASRRAPALRRLCPWKVRPSRKKLP